MTIFLKVIIFIIALAIAGGLAARFGKDAHGRPTVVLRNWMFFIGGLVVFLLGIGMLMAVGEVPAGTRGVVLRFGAVTDKTLGEGLYFVMPLVNTVELMSVQVDAYDAEASAASKDLQDVSTVVTLNYFLDENQVNRIYQTLRKDYLTRIARPAVQEAVKSPAVQEAVKSATATYDASELITRRPEVKEAITRALGERLSEHGILIDTVAITDFTFSAMFSQAIEDKVRAEQKALEAENRLREIEVEAQQVETAAVGQANALIAQAEGDKQAAITRAEGEAEAIRTVATAQAEANAEINASLTPLLNQYLVAKELGDDIKVMILPAGQDFIIGESLLGLTPEQDGVTP
jgi:regulator of protease activity HflC (stomatin/prohibitin superfamily)